LASGFYYDLQLFPFYICHSKSKYNMWIWMFWNDNACIPITNVLYRNFDKGKRWYVQYQCKCAGACVEKRGGGGNPVAVACCVWLCTTTGEHSIVVTLFCCLQLYICKHVSCEEIVLCGGRLKQKGDNKWVKSFKPKLPPSPFLTWRSILTAYILDRQ